MKHYHLQSQAQQRGPFPESEVRAMIAAGTLTPKDLCWTQGMSDWRPVEEVIPRLWEAQPPPPLPRAIPPPAGGDQDAAMGPASLRPGDAVGRSSRTSDAPKRAGSASIGYQAGPPAEAVDLGDPSLLLKIAAAHRGMSWSLVFAIGISVLGVVLGLEDRPDTNPGPYLVLFLLSCAIWVNTVVWTYRLARALKRELPSLWAAALFIPLPLFNLIAPLILAQAAQDRLRAAGVTIGIFGANIKEIREREDFRRRASVRYEAGGDR